MELQTAKLMQEFGNDLCIEVEIYENYSGRFMYGTLTTGIVVPEYQNLNEILVSIIGCGDELEEIEIDDEPINLKNVIWDIVNLRSDNMGKSYIFY